MEWSNLYGPDNPPALDSLDQYVNSELWKELNQFLKRAYQIKPKLEYSRCSMQPGWNIKYKKSGKSLCTLYPMEGYFIALVVIGNKEMNKAELLMPLCGKYVQGLYEKSDNSFVGRWLMVNVTDSTILRDVIELIKIRVKPKNL